MTKMIFYFVFILLTVIIECECTNSTDHCPNVKTSLGAIRKRRHLTFPDGSDVILTISLVKAFMTHAPAGWNIAIEIDVIFPLPDAKFTNAQFRRKLHHRQKREFWERLQSAIDYHNLNGRACVIRSICEAKYYLGPPGKSLVHDLLRAIFTPDNANHLKYFTNKMWAFKFNNVSTHNKSNLDILMHYDNFIKKIFRAPIHEEDFTNEMADTYGEILEPNFCDKINDCPFSLLHFTLSMNKQKY